MATDAFDDGLVEKQKELNFIQNLDSVLKLVKKKGSAKQINMMPNIGNAFDIFNQMLNPIHGYPVYPTIDDIKIARNDIFQKYLTMADGFNLVIYNPGARNCDEWGFNIENITLATKRDDVDRFVADDFIHYIIENNTAYWNGSLGSLDKAITAKEGTNFKGWKNTNQYRLTRDEIKQVIGNRIFNLKIGI